MTDTTSFISDFTAEEIRRREALPDIKRRLLKELGRSRIVSVTIAYDGEGDSGQIEDISAYNAAGKLTKLDRRVRLSASHSEPIALYQAIDEFAWELLAVYHGAYYDNEGGYGTIEIDVASGRVHIDHNDRVIDVCNTQTEV